MGKAMRPLLGSSHRGRRAVRADAGVRVSAVAIYLRKHPQQTGCPDRFYFRVAGCRCSTRGGIRNHATLKGAEACACRVIKKEQQDG
jgi:hypothetical protein